MAAAEAGKVLVDYAFDKNKEISSKEIAKDAGKVALNTAEFALCKTTCEFVE